MKLTDPEENRRRVVKGALCRGGYTQTTPFCDGSHKAAGFRAEWRGGPALDAGRRRVVFAALSEEPRTAQRAKNKWPRTEGSLPAISGESVKAGYPLSQSTTTNRNSPKRAPAREGVAIARREAPGGSEGGLTPKHTHDEPQARIRRPPSGPLDLVPTGGRRSKPSPRFFSVGSTRFRGPLGKGAYCRPRKKQMAANRRFAAGDFGGKCERGLPPFTKTVTTNRNSPKRAPARDGVAIARREAPGGSEGGLTPKHTHDEPQARIRRPPSGPLDLVPTGGRRSLSSAPSVGVGETRFAALRAACRPEVGVPALRAGTSVSARRGSCLARRSSGGPVRTGGRVR